MAKQQTRGRDFAQRAGSGRQARRKDEMPGWIWGLAGLAIGLVVAAYIHISKPAAPAAETASAPAKPAKPAAKDIKLPPKEPSRFSFYEILPSYEVVIPREKHAPAAAAPGAAPKPAPIAEPGSYIIQVGSYRERDQAEAQKAQLALLGVESRVEQVTIDNKETWFRVRIGPEKDLGRLHATLSRLSENGIEGMLVKVQG